MARILNSGAIFVLRFRPDFIAYARSRGYLWGLKISQKATKILMTKDLLEKEVMNSIYFSVSIILPLPYWFPKPLTKFSLMTHRCCLSPFIKLIYLTVSLSQTVEGSFSSMILYVSMYCCKISRCFLYQV